MLEPVGAVIFNNVLNTCHYLHPSHAVSAAKVIVNTTQRSITSDFFTPRPRRLHKGKERDFSDGQEGLLLQCTEWSCFVRHSLPHSGKSRADILYGHDRSRRRQPRNSFSFHRQPALSRIDSSRSNYSQKRHASRSSPAYSDHGPSNPSGDNPSDSSNRDDAVPQKPPDKPQSSEHITLIRRLIDISEGRLTNFTLDSAWEAYDQARAAELLGALKTEQYINFAKRYVHRMDSGYTAEEPLERLHKRGNRLKVVVETLQSSYKLNDRQKYAAQCLSCRAFALNGEIDKAMAGMRKIQGNSVSNSELGSALRAYRGIALSIFRHHGGIRLLDFIMKEWHTLGPYLAKLIHYSEKNTLQEIIERFQVTILGMVAQIQDPVDLFRSRRSWSLEKQQIYGSLLIMSFNHARHPLPAHDVWLEMQRNDMTVSSDITLPLIKSLLREQALGPAKNVLASIRDTRTKAYHSTALSVFAHCGEVSLANSAFDHLSAKGWASDHDQASLLHVYSTQGKTEETLQTFDSYFPKDSSGKRTNSPNLVHYNEVLHAYATISDVDGLNAWVNEMTVNGQKPDMHSYTMLIDAFLLRGDMESACSVLLQMREAGVKPSDVTYVHIISTLAQRQDPVRAEAVYKQAIDEGVVPSRRMITAVMHAHVMTGSWRGVIRVFQYLNRLKHPDLALTIEVYNTLIKAYVHIGAPFRIVSKIFSKLEFTSARPDSYTYALLIESACDNDLMMIARNILDDMDRAAKHWSSSVAVTAYVMTVMMSGFLRKEDIPRARAVFESMQERGIQPTSGTYNAILRRYANDHNSAAIQLAQDFIQDLLKAPEKERHWNIPADGQPSALHRLYDPLMKGYLLHKRYPLVQSTFQEFLDAGGQPNLNNLTYLLDSYRRSKNIIAVRELWPQLFDLGMKFIRDSNIFGKDEPDKDGYRYHGNILSSPLSIYIDALSKWGLHSQVAHTWRQFQVNNLPISADNWNALIVALIRAGKVDRAFQVIENVIIPYRKYAMAQFKTGPKADERPETPLLFDAEPNATVLRDMRTQGVQRREQVKKHIWMFEKLGKNMDGEPMDSYFTVPLKTMNLQSPPYTMWRIKTGVMGLLTVSLARLQRRQDVRFVKTNSAGLLPGEMPVENADTRLPGHLLADIEDNYPMAVKMVRKFMGFSKMRREKKQRMLIRTIAGTKRKMRFKKWKSEGRIAKRRRVAVETS